MIATQTIQPTMIMNYNQSETVIKAVNINRKLIKL